MQAQLHNLVLDLFNLIDRLIFLSTLDTAREQTDWSHDVVKTSGERKTMSILSTITSPRQH